MPPRLDILEELRAALEALERAPVPHALRGGLALAVHGVPRATKDIDFLVMEGDLGRAQGALAQVGFTLGAGPTTFGAGTPQERRLHRVTKVAHGEHLTVDLMLVSPVYAAVWASRTEVLWEGRVVPVVSRDGLRAMKRLAGRPQDLADLAALEDADAP